MCNLSWTPHSNLEKDNSLNTPVLAHLSADLIAIVECVNRESYYEHLMFRVSVYGLVNFIWWTGIDFEHRHERNSYLFGLFKQASQCNEVIPKIRTPDRGKNKQQKLVIRPDSC